MERATGRRPVELDGPACPEAAVHLWGWFVDLAAGRRSNGFGPEPLASGEIRDWAALSAITPMAWEFQALRRLDQAYLLQKGREAEKRRRLG